MRSYKTIPFDNSGFYFIVILVIVVLGFSPSYFSKIASHTSDFDKYTHFHAFMMSTWMLSLIIQPFLIRSKNFRWHRILGKVSYLQVPLLIVSILLLTHHNLQTVPLEEVHFALHTPFKDLMIISICFGLAIYYRKNAAYHARFIIGAAIPIIEPSIARCIIFYGTPSAVIMDFVPYLIVDSVILLLFLFDRKNKHTRWIFMFLLLLVFFLQAFSFIGINSSFWKNFSIWFTHLNLT